MSDEIFFANLSAKNEQFWSGTLGPDGLNALLQSWGLVIEKCVLIDLSTDSGTIWIVRLINQDGQGMKFDVEFDPPNVLEAAEIQRPHQAAQLREHIAAERLSQLIRGAG